MSDGAADVAVRRNHGDGDIGDLAALGFFKQTRKQVDNWARRLAGQNSARERDDFRRGAHVSHMDMHPKMVQWSAIAFQYGFKAQHIA